MAKIGVFGLERSKQTIQRSVARFLGLAPKPGSKFFFDRRGVIEIPAGQRGVKAAAGGYHSADPMVLTRPANGQYVSAEKAMASHYGWVYACVKAISDEMAGIDFELFKIQNSKGDVVQITTGHDLLDLMDGINDRQTGPEFKKLLAMHLELTGNAYIYLYGVKDYLTKPKAMYLLDPGQTKVVLNKGTFPFSVNYYETRIDQKVYTFKDYEVVQLKYPDPNNQFVGMGTPMGIAEWIDNDNAAMTFNSNFFKNGARLNGIFKTQYTSIEQTQRLKIAFEEEFQGLNNAYKTMILPKDVEWVPNQASFKDMDFSQGLDKTAERIRAGFRVSNTILGIVESETNRATAETADYVFATRTIKPKMEMIISYLNEFLVPRYGSDIYLWYADPTPDDVASESLEIRTVTAGKQIMTQNEARMKYLGLPEIEGGDKLSTDTMNTIGPDSSSPDGGQSATSRSHKKIRFTKGYLTRGGSRKQIFKTQFWKNSQMRQDIMKDLAAKLAEKLSQSTKLLEVAQSKSIKDLTDDEYVARFFPEQKSRRDDYYAKFMAAIDLLVSKQEKQVKKNLEGAIKKYFTVDKKEIVASKLFDFKEWVNIFIDGLTPIATSMFSEESASALRNINARPINLLDDENVSDSLDKRMGLLAQSYNQTLLDTLESKLNEGLANGDSLAELTDSVSEIYVWSKTDQAQRTSKTETVAISNDANKEAWKKAGTVSEVKWITSEKDNVCEFCAAMNGKTIDIDENFFDKGDDLKVGDKTLDLDYSAVGGPPLHPNCGCLIRPAAFNPLHL